MAVTTTYSLNFVKNLDLTQGPTTSSPDATSLANGGFAVSGDFAVGVALDIFNPDTSDGGGSVPMTFYSYAVDQLNNGNIVIVGRDTDSFRYVIRTATGGPVAGPTDPGFNNTAVDVAALAGGGFCIVGGGPSDGPHDIDVYIRNNSGGEVTTFAVDLTDAADFFPSVAGLDNGATAVAWTRDVGGESEVWYAVYNSGGGVIRAPALFDTLGTVNILVSVSAKSGGFVIAYEGNGWGTGSNDITLAQFSLNGTFEQSDNVSNPSLVDDGSNDSSAHMARLSNNYLTVAYSEFIFPDGDTVVRLVDPANGAVLATRYVTGGESASDAVRGPTVAGFANGGIAVFHSNLTDNDVDGEHLQAQRTSTGDAAANVINGDSLLDVMSGNGGNDTLRGFDGNDTLRGGIGNDALVGGNGNDRLLGDTGIDRLTGGTGRDVMTGGAGADRIIFTKTAESGLTNTTRDRVTDFTHLSDDLDLATIDAKTSVAGNNTFSFRGTLAFNAEGQVRVVQSGAHTIVQLNTTGLTGAEMTIQLDNFTATALTASDFIF